MLYSFLKPQYKVKLKRFGDHSDGGYLIPEQCVKHVDFLDISQVSQFNFQQEQSLHQHFK